MKFGHVERSSGAARITPDKEVVGTHQRRRPKITWKKMIESDCHKSKLTTVDPKER